jgi:SH3 domain protein
LFWQFTASGDGPFYGVESLELDLNYFNGDAETFARRFSVPLPTDPIPPDPAGNRYRVKLDTPPPPPPPPVGQRYRVTATRLNVREGPDTNFRSIGLLDFNEVVTAIGVNPDGTWSQGRRSDGLTGWSSAQFLALVTQREDL